jgi:hypothetical protein
MPCWYNFSLGTVSELRVAMSDLQHLNLRLSKLPQWLLQGKSSFNQLRVRLLHCRTPHQWYGLYNLSITLCDLPNSCIQLHKLHIWFVFTKK